MFFNRILVLLLHSSLCFFLVVKTMDNPREFSPLHEAVINASDDRAPVKALLASGDDIDEKTNNELAETALHRAARYGNLAIAQTLLEQGANLHATNVGGETPLKIAHRRVPELIRLCVAFGYGLDARDWKFIDIIKFNREEHLKVFCDPLEEAAARGDAALVQFLLQNKTKDSEYYTSLANALVFAAGQGHKTIVDYLLHLGAPTSSAHLVVTAALLRIERQLRQQAIQNENLQKKKNIYELIDKKLSALQNYILSDANDSSYLRLLPRDLLLKNCIPLIFPQLFSL
jgi:ankyrin repeat protein